MLVWVGQTPCEFLNKPFTLGGIFPPQNPPPSLSLFKLMILSHLPFQLFHPQFPYSPAVRQMRRSVAVERQIRCFGRRVYFGKSLGRFAAKKKERTDIKNNEKG